MKSTLQAVKLFALLCVSLICLQACEPEEENNLINGYEYVDLGLSVKWATCNLGATVPEDCGNYFAWGELESKESFTQENSVTYYDTGIGFIAGHLFYDAARNYWDDTWRIPTKREMQELIDNCTRVWTSLDSVNGTLFVSKKNGNSIFLPATGYRYDTIRYGFGYYSRYWCASTLDGDSKNAYYLYTDKDLARTDKHERFYGQTIRPVAK